ncbi:MAG: S1C family serine protease [Propionibacteriaceae bacterium]|jgi:S1-C subfamily serine protease|nr:S1C family serine protease [Propionibacteriaceae bacterium]
MIRKRSFLVGAALAAAATLVLGASLAAAPLVSATATGQVEAGPAADEARSGPAAGQAQSGPGGPRGPHGGSGPVSGSGSGSVDDSESGSASATSTLADADQATGVVLIDTVVNYGNAAAAGTGLVIGSDGLVVTNHHVVEGSTEVNVTVPATGETFAATVLGYSAVDDVAVLRLDGASGLDTVTFDPDGVAVGESITVVGNARGAGRLVAAGGKVTGTGVDITVSSEDGQGSSRLEDLIEVDAALVSGDSGGATLDGDGEVVGMNVAGSADERVSAGYAIPIATVLDVAQKVLVGAASDTVTIGGSAALGVLVSGRYSGGAAVVGVYAGGAAAAAGISAGSLITQVDGQAVAQADDLTAILALLAPGDAVDVTWTDRTGQHTATVTLGTAPLA